MIDFVSLHTHTHSSMLDGFSTDADYLDKAQELRQRGLGVSDHGNLFTIYSFLKKAKERGMLGVPGCEFYVAPINPQGAKRKEAVFYGPGGNKAEQYDVSSNGAYLHLTVWAYNNVGLHNLFRLSTLSNDPSRFYQKPRIDFDMLADNSEGLIVSTGCPSSEISTRFLLGQDDKAYEYAGRLKEVFGDRLFVEIMDHNMPIDLEKILLPKQLELSKKMGIELLATNDCHYAEKHDAISHEEMLCVQSGSKMSDPTYDNGGNRFAFSGNEYYLKSGDQMAELFPQRDFPNALSNSVKIAEMASDISLDYNPNLKPKPVIPSEFKDEVDYYKHLIQNGFKERYGDSSVEVKKEAIKRNKKEFEVIHSSDFIGYMLVVRDYLNFARENYSTRNEQDEIIALSIGGGRGCFLPGNKVRMKNGYKNIEDIKLLTANNNPAKTLTHDNVVQEVEDVFEYDVIDEDCIEITLSNGDVISCTADHRIFSKERGFVEAETLQTGDVLLGPKRSHDLTTINCDNCTSETTQEVRFIRRNMSTDSYKEKGEYFCTKCANKILYKKIEAVKNGAQKGSLKNKSKESREKNRRTQIEKWKDSDYRDYRVSTFKEFAKSKEYKKACSERNKRRYSDPKELQKLVEQGRKGYKKGIFKSEKSLTNLIRYDSSYELKALNIFETDSDVAYIGRCNDRIEYVLNGEDHIYLPDFFIGYTNGSKKVIEIKAQWDVETEKTQEKISAAKVFYQQKGISYEVWTEKELEKYNDPFHNDFEIVSVKKFKYTGKVYDLQVKGARNYTVSDVTVHNSVGGSIHAYELGISEVDPIEHDLIFERFLSAGRGATYLLEYDDGTTEEIVVSETKQVISDTDNDENNVLAKKYIHQLQIGDKIVVDDIDEDETEKENND